MMFLHRKKYNNVSVTFFAVVVMKYLYVYFFSVASSADFRSLVIILIIVITTTQPKARFVGVDCGCVSILSKGNKKYNPNLGNF